MIIKNVIVVYFSLLTLLSTTLPNLVSGDQIINDANTVQKWVTSADAFDNLLWPQRDNVKSLIVNITSNWHLPISQPCSKSLNDILIGWEQRKLWAYQFLEASAGNKPGFLRGYISDLGNYRECLSIVHDAAEIRGQYCLLRVHFPLPEKPASALHDSMNLNLNGTSLEDSYYSTYASELKFLYNNTFSFGFCIPTSCSKQDFETITTKVFQGTHLTPKVYSCEKIEPNELPRPPRYQRTAMSILAMLVLFVIFSTLVTYFYNGHVSPYLSAFSAIENTKKLISDTNDEANQRLQFMHCVRFSLRVFGLLGHIYLTLGITPHLFPVFSYNLPDQWFLRETWKHMFIFIEVFFLMSGFLTVYTWYPEIKRRNGNVSFYQYTLARFFRSTPLFLGVLLLLFVFAGIGSGPIFSELRDMIAGNCLKYWWTNIFYISNWIQPSKMCYPNWWSVSIDFQLYCISYLPMIWFITNPKRGVIAILSLIGLGPLITSLVAFFRGVPVLTCCRLDYDQEAMFAEHFSTYSHAAPYYLGMLVGYLVVTNKRITNKFLIALGWIFATCCWVGTFVASYYFVDSQLDRFVEVAYVGLQKLMFTVFYAWLFYAFSFKTGGIVQKNMSIKIFVPFSRLTYSIAMSEMLFIWYDLTNSHQYFPSDAYNETMRVVYIFWMCTILGYLVFLLFEAPSLNLMKLLIKPRLTKAESTSKPVNGDHKLDKTD